MDLLTAILAILVAIAILYDLARRIGIPYPTLLVVGGLGLGLIPGVPHIELEPELVLLVFLPPLLFGAAVDTPARELRANLAPLVRLAVGLVVFTMIIVAVVANAVVPSLGWAAAFALGAIVAPTDALAATSVFRRTGAPRIVVTLIEGEALFNDATALVAYRTAVVAAVAGTFVLADALGTFLVAALGGIVLGYIAGRAAAVLLKWLDNPPVEVAISVVVPFAAYLPAEQLGLSGVLASVTAGLVIGSRLGTILTPSSRILWLTSWKMIGFVLNGFAFVLIGLALPDVLTDVGGRSAAEVIGMGLLISAVVIVTRLAWVFASSLLPGSPRRIAARTNPRLATWLTFMVGWAGLRGAVSLAAALALPESFPERNLILVVTFIVILVTLVGQGLTLPWVMRRAAWDGRELDGDELNTARAAAYRAGLEELTRSRAAWNSHGELFDRLESGLQDRTSHLATDDAEETEDRRRERDEHEQIQRGIINAQRAAVIELRDRGEINDQTLRSIEHELDLEELRMEG
jgi:Na+/H+ antiporter